MFSSSSSQPSGVSGQRAYVVGDIHGRLDLLDRLLDKLHAELRERPADKTVLVFVGDLIDRGPSSAQVVERLRTYRHPGVSPVFILGNHEEVLLRILGGDAELITKWRWFGGTQCLESYGVDVAALASLDSAAALAEVRQAIPSSHVEFLESFVDSCRFGDYLFEPMRNALGRYAMWAPPPITPDWADDSWARGAAALATQRLFDFESRPGEIRVVV